MTNRHFKDAIYEQLARVGKAMASPRRLELLELLCQSPYTVQELADLSNQSLANTSQHLRQLHGARLVETDRLGVQVRYRLAGEDVCALYRQLRSLAGVRLAEVEQVTRSFLEDRDAMEPVDREELVRRVQRGAVTVLDVRPAAEFAAGHLPGAVSVPLVELERRLSELPPDREVIAYCRGPYCVLAVEAVERLRRHGFVAHRLEDGVPDWRARGLRVAHEADR